MLVLEINDNLSPELDKHCVVMEIVSSGSKIFSKYNKFRGLGAHGWGLQKSWGRLCLPQIDGKRLILSKCQGVGGTSTDFSVTEHMRIEIINLF